VSAELPGEALPLGFLERLRMRSAEAQTCRRRAVMLTALALLAGAAWRRLGLQDLESKREPLVPLPILFCLSLHVGFVDEPLTTYKLLRLQTDATGNHRIATSCNLTSRQLA
jgi:hypothetical protein